jgi:hypothetical protein
MMHYGAMSYLHWLSPRPACLVGRDAASISTLMGLDAFVMLWPDSAPMLSSSQASLVKLGFGAGRATSSIRRSNQLKAVAVPWRNIHDLCYRVLERFSSVRSCRCAVAAITITSSKLF